MVFRALNAKLNLNKSWMARWKIWENITLPHKHNEHGLDTFSDIDRYHNTINRPVPRRLRLIQGSFIRLVNSKIRKETITFPNVPISRTIGDCLSIWVIRSSLFREGMGPRDGICIWLWKVTFNTDDRAQRIITICVYSDSWCLQLV